MAKFRNEYKPKYQGKPRQIIEENWNPKPIRKEIRLQCNNLEEIIGFAATAIEKERAIANYNLEKAAIRVISRLLSDKAQYEKFKREKDLKLGSQR